MIINRPFDVAKAPTKVRGYIMNLEEKYGALQVENSRLMNKQDDLLNQLAQRGQDDEVSKDKL